MGRQVLAAAVLSSLLCLVVPLHIIIALMLILHKIIFAAILPDIATARLLHRATTRFDEVLEHLCQVILLSVAHVVKSSAALKSLSEHGLRKALSLEIRVVLEIFVIAHVEKILQVL